MVGQKCFMFFFKYICLNVEMYLCTLKNVFGPIDCFLQAWVDQLAKCQLRPCPPSQDCVSNPRPIPILTSALYFALLFVFCICMGRVRLPPLHEKNNSDIGRGVEQNYQSSRNNFVSPCPSPPTLTNPIKIVVLAGVRMGMRMIIRKGLQMKTRGQSEDRNEWAGGSDKHAQ